MFEGSRSYLYKGAAHPCLASGLHWLCRARVKAIWTAKEFLNIKYLDPRWENQCPMCLAVGGTETLEHLFLRCSRWRQQRRKHLRPLLRVMTERAMLAGVVERSLRSELRVRYLLGGAYVTEGNEEHHLPHWLVGEIDATLLEAAVQAYTEGRRDRIEGLPAYIKVARFLQEVMPLRFRILGPLLQAQRADVNNVDRAVLVEDPGEEGT